MNKKTTGVVAGVAGAALLMGGATFALWNDSATIEGGELSSGNLDIGEVSQVWEDVSDGVERGAIDLSDFVIVPGDTIRGTITVPVSLEGDHMYADIEVPDPRSFAEGDLYEGLLLEKMALTVDGTPLPANATKFRFASADNADTKNLRTIGANSTIELVVEATFDPATDEQELTKAVAELEDLNVTLTQVRN